MAIQITHSFVSMKGDGGDATLVRPSNWNAVHDTSMATGNLVGRISSGAGAFEEVPISTYMAGLLSAASKDALADLLGLFTTGDVKFSYDSSPAAGWMLVNASGGSIGNAGSGATLRANADTKALYLMIYSNLAESVAPVSGGRTGNAENDFNAGKVLYLYLTGRAIIGAGSGGTGVSGRTQGELPGTETHTLTTAQMPAHYHSAGIYDPGHTHSASATSNLLYNTGGTEHFVQAGAGWTRSTGGISIGGNVTGVRVNSSNGIDTTYSTGSGGAHNNMQPSIALYTHVKL